MIALTRRRLLTGIGSLLAGSSLAPQAMAAGALDALAFGLDPANEDDQSAILQAAIDSAAADGKDLLLPSGTFNVTGIAFPRGMRIVGTPGATHLESWGGGPVGRASGVGGIIIDGVTFGGRAGGDSGLLLLEDADRITIRNCAFGGSATGIFARSSSATIEDCWFIDLADAAIHSTDSAGGLMIHGNRIDNCGNAGIRIWRQAPGHDGSIVSGNAITHMRSDGGGNGQNGNGINVFQADSVIVSDNVIADCAFSAVRVNAGRNTQVRGNTCLNSGEVAIFSEFGFSGSVIADNIVDGAATGIDITNFDVGGHLATCTGNIVRNISPSSAVNPDTRPVGIYAEADTVVANNVIEAVPGVGIAAGYGPFVRNVSVTDNVLTGCTIGIGVTVVNDPGVGRVTVNGNTISGATAGGIVGLEWEHVVSDDLARDAGRYAHVSVAENVTSGG